MADQSSAQQQYPNLNPYSNGTMNNYGNSYGSNDTQSKAQGAAQSTMESAQSTMDSIRNHPTYQSTTASAQNTMDSIKNHPTVQSISQGPVVDKARNEASATKNELSNLASSRQTPDTQTATGQNLTHYHSFFYNLLSWENPRATAVAYSTIVLAIFAYRYLPVARYVLKGLYIVLGITAAAELAGRLVLGEGVATKIRPRQYYVIPRETMEGIMGDLTELVNFFVIEFQRVLFAENVAVTIGAFATTLLTYLLIKITPPWGLGLLFTTVAFFAPLIYIKNHDLIHHHINNASDLVSKQSAQVRDLASQHTSKAAEASKSALRDYSTKASEMVGASKQKAVEKGLLSKETVDKVPGGGAGGLTGENFPSVPSVQGQSASSGQEFPSAPSGEPAKGDVNGTAEEVVQKTNLEPVAA